MLFANINPSFHINSVTKLQHCVYVMFHSNIWDLILFQCYRHFATILQNGKEAKCGTSKHSLPRSMWMGGRGKAV